MIADITNWIMTAMHTHGPAMVFTGVIIESIIVPIPSPIIIMGAGALLIDPGLPWTDALTSIIINIVLPGSVASTLGAYFTFLIAYGGGKPLITKMEKFLGFGWDAVVWMEKKLGGRAHFMIFLLRALPIVPLSLISAAAGVLRINVWTFTLWTFLGSLPRCLSLGILGFMTRDAYRHLAGNLNKMESVLSAIIVCAAFGVILWLRTRMRQSEPK